MVKKFQHPQRTSNAADTHQAKPEMWGVQGDTAHRTVRSKDRGHGPRDAAQAVVLMLLPR